MSEKIVQLNEEVIKDQIKELVRGSVEETAVATIAATSPPLLGRSPSKYLSSKESPLKQPCSRIRRISI